MISIGTIGLIKGISTFKPDKKVRLATYASRCIENEILMYFRGEKKRAGTVSLSDAPDGEGEGNALSLLDTLSVEDDMWEELDAKDAGVRVRRCVLSELEPREREVICLRYGLGRQEPQTQRAVAEHCGISRSYVSRIEKKALEKLRQALER